MDFFAELPAYVQALIATLYTWGVTALGASLVFFMKKPNKNFLDACLGVAAGVMIAASFFSLLSPAVEIADSLGKITWLNVAVGFMLGGVFLFIGDKIFAKKTKNINSKTKRIKLLIFSITLHNIPEGLAVGVAFGSVAYGLEGASLLSAILLAIGIGIQNFPEGSAISIPLYREGYSKKKSFFIGQLSAIVEVFAGVIGAILVITINNLLPLLLSFAAGAMIYVVIEELIPESQTNENKEMISIWSLIGFAIMMILDVALG